MGDVPNKNCDLTTKNGDLRKNNGDWSKKNGDLAKNMVVEWDSFVENMVGLEIP